MFCRCFTFWINVGSLTQRFVALRLFQPHMCSSPVPMKEIQRTGLSLHFAIMRRLVRLWKTSSVELLRKKKSCHSSMTMQRLTTRRTTMLYRSILWSTSFMRSIQTFHYASFGRRLFLLLATGCTGTELRVAFRFSWT